MSKLNTKLHPWNVTPDKARNIQQKLNKEVIGEDQLDQVRFVGGVDVGFEKNNNMASAAIAILKFPELELHEYSVARMPVSFPYIPGLLSFREVPALLKALKKLKQLPDLLLCDGQGIAHPRRFGIACHLGLLSGVPSIGVAKKRLTGSHESVPQEKGSWTPLFDKEEIIGAVLRSRTNVKPLYISIGHKICLNTAIYYVMRCTTRFRLPETTRWAHKLASG
jgi:deoxyribonuclease V